MKEWPQEPEDHKKNQPRYYADAFFIHARILASYPCNYEDRLKKGGFPTFFLQGYISVMSQALGRLHLHEAKVELFTLTIKFMQKNKKYLIFAVMMIITVTGMSFSSVGFAQTPPTLSCSVGTSSVGVGQPAILTASGGTGTYFWAGDNLTVTNSAGTQFSVSYPNAGSYLITVMSGTQTANCVVNVSGSVPTGTLSCLPLTQNVTLGQSIAVSATGGNGSYTWSSPELRVINPNGSGFSANYASVGLKTLTVTSAGSVATCTINVLSNSVPPITPGFPNTGGGYGQ